MGLQATVEQSAADVLNNLANHGILPDNVGLLTKKVVVSSAEVLALFATPKELVPAPGAGFALQLIDALLVLDYAGVAYATNGIIAIYETDEAGTQVSGALSLASFLAQTADIIKAVYPVISDTVGLTLTENVPLVLGEATAETITGTSDIEVHLRYRIVPTALNA